jgi:molybdopterin-guanine dinucleotide biosynthesis protein A
MGKNFSTNFGGAVLAGGESKRMGFDKALLEIDGKPLISRVVDSVNRAGITDLKIVGGDSDSFELLGYDYLTDDYPGEGPLGGIITALNYFKTHGKKHVLIVACDLPNISEILINQILEDSLMKPESIVLPVVEGHLQWMHALWPTAVLTTLLKSFSSGVRAPWRATEGLTLLKIEGVDPLVLFDVDQPEDLTKVL